MRKKKTKKESDEATRAGVQEEMAKPRMAKSAREEVWKRFAGRITPPKPSRRATEVPDCKSPIREANPITLERS